MKCPNKKPHEACAEGIKKEKKQIVDCQGTITKVFCHKIVPMERSRKKAFEWTAGEIALQLLAERNARRRNCR